MSVPEKIIKIFGCHIDSLYVAKKPLFVGYISIIRVYKYADIVKSV